jgi:hypothetical protein
LILRFKKLKNMQWLWALILFSFLGKLTLHFYLDFTRKDNANLRDLFAGGGVSPWQLFFWYMELVDNKYKVVKKICNFLWIVFVISVVIFFISLVYK